MPAGDEVGEPTVGNGGDNSGVRVRGGEDEAEATEDAPDPTTEEARLKEPKIREEREACRARFCLDAIGCGRTASLGVEVRRGAGADRADEMEAVSSSLDVESGKVGCAVMAGESKAKASSAMAEVRSSRFSTTYRDERQMRDSVQD